MPDITIREVTGEDLLSAYAWLPVYAFHATPPLIDAEERRKNLEGRECVRHLALYENGTAVATAASWDMSQNVRGKLMGMGGIFNVVAHPAARRKGYIRQLMGRMLALLHEDDRPVSGLYPFRESFYERLGYTTFQQVRQARFSPQALLPLLKNDFGGSVELVQAADGLDLLRRCQYKLQETQHGFAVFDAPRPMKYKDNPEWMAVARVDGEVAGLMLYTLKGEKPMHFLMEAGRFYYHQPAGRYLLLDWIARHADQAERVEIILPAKELPETWLADLDVKTEPHHITPMGRVVDVPALGGIGCGVGRFSARLVDPLCPWNEGAWSFEGTDGTLQVTRANAAECELTIQGLSALVYGTHDPADFPYRGWGSPAGATLAAMREMFLRALPFMNEFY